MPILNSQLDQDGHATVDLVILPAAPRRKALQAAAQVVPPPQFAPGMIDPGAAFTVIDTQVRQSLGLVPFRVCRITVPNTPVAVRVWAYKIDLAIQVPAGILMLRPMLSVVEMPIIQTGVEVLVGTDVLSECCFTHNGSAGTFSLAF